MRQTPPSAHAFLLVGGDHSTFPTESLGRAIIAMGLSRVLPFHFGDCPILVCFVSVAGM